MKGVVFVLTFLIILAVIILLCLIKIKVVIHIDNAKFSAAVFILGIFKIKREFVLKREKDKILSVYQTGKREKRIITLYDIIRTSKMKTITRKQKGARKKALKYILKRLHLDIKLFVEAGFVDAYVTAMLCGLISVITKIGGAVMDGEKHSIETRIKPLFSYRFISVKASCIIASTPANIIIGYIIYKIKNRW